MSATAVAPSAVQREAGSAGGATPGYSFSAVQGGAPLSSSQRAYFEPRFGVDFSAVRIHHGSLAHAVAEAVGARAYTLGSDIVFGSGYYNPSSEQCQRLMAHELTHVVQQQGRAASQSIMQRAMKFEYQVKDSSVTNLLLRDNGSTVTPLPRKYGPEDFLVKGSTGVRLESETHGQPEFETGWERTWSKLGSQILQAVGMCARMNAATDVTGSDGKTYKEFPFAEPDIKHLRPGQGFEARGSTWHKNQKTGRRLVNISELNVRSSPGVPRPGKPETDIGKLNRGAKLKVIGTKGSWIKIESGSVKGWVYEPHTEAETKRYESNGGDTMLRTSERILVKVTDHTWKAYIQISESFELGQFDSYLEQLDTQGLATGLISDTPGFVTAFDKGPAGESLWGQWVRGASFVAANDKLKNFLLMVAYYIRMGAANPTTHSDGSPGPAKWAFPLMSRTNFGSIHNSLSKSEQELFKRMVQDDVKGILPTMGISKTDKLLVSGHGGGSGPTVYAWLTGIIQGKDLLSGAGFSGAMGRFRTEEETGKNAGLIRFEGRRTSGNSQTALEWLPHAFEHFEKSRTLRSRPSGKGQTGLKR